MRAAALAFSLLATAGPHAGDAVVLYEDTDFHGHALRLGEDQLDLGKVAFNDATSSFKVRFGYQATFYEDVDGKGRWFTINCGPVLGARPGEFCEVKNAGTMISTGRLCQFKLWSDGGCPAYWNDRISGVGKIGPADPAKPQGLVDWGG